MDKNQTYTRVTISPDLHKGLRALRVYHWQKASEHRHMSNVKPMYPHIAKWHVEQADFHIKQVQLLNEFFEIGDTAESDAYTIEDARRG